MLFNHFGKGPEAGYFPGREEPEGREPGGEREGENPSENRHAGGMAVSAGA